MVGIEPSLFQSAPLTEARGDADNLRTLPPIISFNPLPLPKQGEMAASSLIRPPTRQFQSAPLTEARGDGGYQGEIQEGFCFNPLPLPKQGEIIGCGLSAQGQNVSIRSPYRSKGRLD